MTNQFSLIASFLSELQKCNEKVIVLASPGSRLTPLLIAFEESPQFEVYMVIDERQASFQALGWARAGKSTILLCTSGSAPAHYTPAILEAKKAKLPLLVMASDRPVENKFKLSDQTFTQENLFQGLELPFYNIDLQSFLNSENDFRFLAAQIKFQSLRGPVLINMALRKPLEPSTKDIENYQNLSSAQFHFHSNFEDFKSQLNDSLLASKRPLLILGHKNQSPLRRLEHTGIPVFSDLLSASKENDFTSIEQVSKYNPDLIVYVGGLCIENALQNFLGDFQGQLYCLSTDVMESPLSRPGHYCFSDQNYLQISYRSQQWREKRKTKEAPCFDDFQEVGFFYHLFQLIDDQTHLIIGNSLSIRAAEKASKFYSPQCSIIAQRGLNGIDGLISGAIGYATARKENVILALGDLSVLHDLASLSQELPANLKIVTFINGGGEIFRKLPVSNLESTFEKCFFTPYQEKPWVNFPHIKTMKAKNQRDIALFLQSKNENFLEFPTKTIRQHQEKQRIENDLENNQRI
jgi:2-succinyl-5-enolpyruvyl-6-hydroxy-3-cyclohexene-1-carboxylate synthase